MTDSESQRWPSITVTGWQGTRDTLVRYTQIVGKIRLANEPQINHWSNATLLAFLQSTYDAAAVTAHWDRLAVERPNGTDHHA